jgi:hypothetical protein
MSKKLKNDQKGNLCCIGLMDAAKNKDNLKNTIPDYP